MNTSKAFTHGHSEPIRKIISGGPSPTPAKTIAKTPAKEPAKPPTSTAGGEAVALADLPGVGNIRPGEVEVLEHHGIKAGIRKGILSIERLYAPAAAGIILKSRGGNQP